MSIPAITPYPMPTETASNRVAWRPDARRAALLVHDMQAYFLNKFDRAQSPAPELVANAFALREACSAAGVPVFYTAQPVEQPAHDRALLNDFWGPGLTDARFHAEQPIIDELAPRANDVVLTKWRYSAFQRSDLAEQLRALGRDQLIVCGIYAHIGCMATALEAFMRDIQAFLVIDAVADFSLAEHRMAVDYVSRRCGASLTLAQVNDALKDRA
ncbi:isochorismatase family protein [Hydrogenophaga sp. BPS33]|uniref:isochorismatase family protein n=1 Tax=Hydrogenophaga sp. BPS33 TaxID=2651974 RepID=UPI00131FE0C1|nr:isochorismatase family protein [Hydrogenophaga sp. BPS33]QHE87700.1 isochorismatase family protein [Hydrogenophaga sp. BPS33]